MSITMRVKCPNCNKTFELDDASVASIMSQVRDSAFESELNKRIEDMLAKLSSEKDSEIARLQSEILRMQMQLKTSDVERELEITKAVTSLKEESSKQLMQMQNDMSAQKEHYELVLKEKDVELDFYKNLKTKMSTKMIGETLEQHCEMSFNSIRMTAFPNAYFEKDNVVSKESGSKGDFIFRDYDDDGTEIVSIMFEMKNDSTETKVRHKNESFFKELDKDRHEKHCEYAVLVSLLESDNDFYNNGIVDVSYRYDKMYVIRPQFFIPMITLLRNAALNALSYKKELELVKAQDIDVSHFEENLLSFKDAFLKNYGVAHSHFMTAVEEIDKSIEHLQKVKNSLLRSDNQYRLASDKVEDINLKKLTKNAPSVMRMIEESRV